MRYALLIVVLLFGGLCWAEPTEKSMVQIDRDKILAEALACLTKATPDLDVSNFELVSIDYHDYNGPAGSQPLLTVTFKLLDSKVVEIQGNETTTTYTTRQVMFQGAALPGTVGGGGKTMQTTVANQ